MLREQVTCDHRQSAKPEIKLIQIKCKKKKKKVKEKTAQKFV